MKRVYSTLLLATLLLLSIELPIETVRIAKANPFVTPPNTVWKIPYPQNHSTYETRSMSLSFNIETNYGLLYFYSLDGQEKIAFNTSVISQEPLPSVDYYQTPDGTPLLRKTLQASIHIFNIENGNHTLILYQVYPFSPERPQDGAVISHATILFSISSNLPMESPIPSTSPIVSPIQSDASPTANPSPSVPELSIVILPILIIATLLGTLTLKRRNYSSVKKL